MILLYCIILEVNLLELIVIKNLIQSLVTLQMYNHEEKWKIYFCYTRTSYSCKITHPLSIYIYIYNLNKINIMIINFNLNVKTIKNV